MDFFDKDVLSVDPFPGESDDLVVLHDYFVRTKRGHECANCEEFITSGSRVRSHTAIAPDAKLAFTSYFCTPCSDAMKAGGPNNHDAYLARRKVTI